MINAKISYMFYPIILGLVFGWLFSTVVSGKFLAPKPLPTPKTKSETVRIKPMDLANNIITKNSFELAISPAPIISADGVPQSTPFNGKLIGLIQNAKNHTGIAIINVEGQTVSIKSGIDKDGIKLVSIDNITALIEKNNRQYSLILEGGENKTPGNQMTLSSSLAQTAGSNLNIAIKKDEVRNELKDTTKVLQSALASPVSENGIFQGYRMVKVNDDSPLKKLGLMQGDIITRINGNDLKNPAELFALFNQIDDISAISIDMIRNNDKKTLFVELQ